MNGDRCDINGRLSNGNQFNIKTNVINEDTDEMEDKIVPVCYCYNHWKQIHNQLEFV
jgi:hypothetical protein